MYTPSMNTWLQSMQTPGQQEAQMRANDPNYQNALNSGDYQTSYPVDPATGKPLRPTFQSNLNADGTMKDIYSVKDNLDRTSLDALRAEANRTGPSQWATLQKGMAQDEIAKRNAGATNTAMTNLAMTGGLSSGARERVAATGARNAVMQGQDSSRQIGIQDETNRLNSLNASTNAELQYGNYDQGMQQNNISNALNDVTQKRMFDTNNYNEQMRAWASEKTAAATPSSGKK